MAALRAIDAPERPDRYPFYQAALGELERRRGHVTEARAHFGLAMENARNDAERRLLARRLESVMDRG